MGRYTQRRRAASGPSPEAAASPGIILSAVAHDGDQVLLTWSSPVTLDVLGIGSPDPFKVAGSPMFDAIQIDATHIDIEIVAGSAPGDAWVMPVSPAWIVETVPAPQNGVCT